MTYPDLLVFFITFIFVVVSIEERLKINEANDDERYEMKEASVLCYLRPFHVANIPFAGGSSI